MSPELVQALEPTQMLENGDLPCSLRFSRLEAVNYSSAMVRWCRRWRHSGGREREVGGNLKSWTRDVDGDHMTQKLVNNASILIVRLISCQYIFLSMVKCPGCSKDFDSTKAMNNHWPSCKSRKTASADVLRAHRDHKRRRLENVTLDQPLIAAQDEAGPDDPDGTDIQPEVQQDDGVVMVTVSSSFNCA